MRGELTIEGGQDLLDCISPGIDQHPRSQIDLQLKGNIVHIIIEADDPVAMRASMSSVLQLISVYTKTKDIQ